MRATQVTFARSSKELSHLSAEIFFAFNWVARICGP